MAGRGRLLDALTVAFLARQSSVRELDLFFDIARCLLGQVDPAARALFAQRVVGFEAVPESVLTDLATGEIAVAGPVLRGAPGLGEPALVALSETLPDGHLAQLARRERLTAPVTDVLARRGGVAVLRQLSRNITSVLSDAGLRRLIAAAAEDDEVCRALATRADLPAADSERIVQRVALMLRGRMPGTPALPPPREDTATAASEPKRREDGISLPPRARAAKRADIGILIAQVRSHTLALDDVVAQLAEEDRSNDIAIAFARLCQLDEMAIMKILVRKDGDGIAMVARALDLTEETWSAVVEFRRRRLKLTEAETRFERQDYVLRSADKARATLAQFQTKRAAAR